MSRTLSQNWRRASISLDEDALRHNLATVRACAPGSQVMAVIKADGYGHGMLRVAELLDEADSFAVAMTDEALALRQAGCDKDIVVLHGFDSEDELTLYSEHRLQTVVHQIRQLEILQQHSLPAPVDVWLKVDTGMHRLGVSMAQSQAMIDALQACENVASVAVMSHFANADEPSNSLNNNQIDNIVKVKTYSGLRCSMANSAAILKLPMSHFDVVRPGIMLYGSSPFAEVSADALGLRPVMQFESRLIAIKPVSAGEAIGYGSTYTPATDIIMGIVAVGYGDGYPRHATSGTPVWLNGNECVLIGRVSMDSLCIDITAITAQIGDRVVLWGRELSVDRVAQSSATIAYEILCSAGAATGADRAG